MIIFSIVFIFALFIVLTIYYSKKRKKNISDIYKLTKKIEKAIIDNRELTDNVVSLIKSKKKPINSWEEFINALKPKYLEIYIEKKKLEKLRYPEYAEKPKSVWIESTYNVLAAELTKEKYLQAAFQQLEEYKVPIYLLDFKENSA